MVKQYDKYYNNIVLIFFFKSHAYIYEMLFEFDYIIKLSKCKCSKIVDKTGWIQGKTHV